MVGFGQLGGDNDDLEIGSDVMYVEDNQKGFDTQLRNQSTNMTSMEFKNKEEYTRLVATKQKTAESNKIELSPAIHSQQIKIQQEVVKKPSSRMAKIHVDMADIENKHQIDTDSIVEILKQSLYGPYQVCSQKLNVDLLIRKNRILPEEVENQLRTKIKFKVNCENKPLKRIMIDFGPYPLQKDWLIKQQPLAKENIKTGLMDSKRVFSPPEKDSDPSLGVKSLVIELQKNEFKLDK